MNPAKVQTVQDWKKPEVLCNIRVFFSFTGFYWWFIEGYLEIIRSLNDLTRKGVKFTFETDSEEMKSFQWLKEAFVTTLVLTQFNFNKQIVLETDISDYILVGVLSQYDNNGILHPVAFFLKKYSPAEYNYKIYDKELMAIVWSFEEWRKKLQFNLLELPIKYSQIIRIWNILWLINY